MPDARTHDIITIVTGAALGPISYTVLSTTGGASESAVARTALLVGAHMLSGIMFSPDLDIDSEIDDRWGIFAWIWRLYARLLPHRHFWSHGLILPPLLRLLYFYVVVVGLLIGAAWALGRIGVVVPDYHVRLTNTLVGLIQANPYETLAFAAGFITGGAAHSIADWAVTGGWRFLQRLGITVRRASHSHDRARARLWRSRARSR